MTASTTAQTVQSLTARRQKDLVALTEERRLAEQLRAVLRANRSRAPLWQDSARNTLGWELDQFLRAATLEDAVKPTQEQIDQLRRDDFPVALVVSRFGLPETLAVQAEALGLAGWRLAEWSPWLHAGLPVHRMSELVKAGITCQQAIDWLPLDDYVHPAPTARLLKSLCSAHATAERTIEVVAGGGWDGLTQNVQRVAVAVYGTAMLAGFGGRDRTWAVKTMTRALYFRRSEAETAVWLRLRPWTRKEFRDDGDAAMRAHQGLNAAPMFLYGVTLAEFDEVMALPGGAQRLAALAALR